MEKQEPLKLWLDDVRSTPDDSWLLVTTSQECIAVLACLKVDHLSLDHDLGEPENGTGYDVVKWMEEETFTNPLFIPPSVILIHSANPVGRSNMLAGIVSVRKIAANRK